MIELKNITVPATALLGGTEELNLRFADTGLTVLQGSAADGGEAILRVLSGLERPRKGEVVFRGTVRREGVSDRECWRGAAAGLAGTGSGLLPGETVFTNVELPMRLSGMEKAARRRRAAQLIKRLGLQEKASSLPATLTAAELLRADIARALANDPELLLLTRPLDALLQSEQQELLSLLLAVARDRPVILTAGETLITKDRTDLRRVVLLNGRVLGDSMPPEEEPPAPLPRMPHPVLGLADSWHIMCRSGKGRRGERTAAIVALTLALALLGCALCLPRAWRSCTATLEDDALSVLPLVIRRTELSDESILRLLRDTASSGGHPRDGIYASVSESAWREARNSVSGMNDLNALLDALESDENVSKRVSALQYDSGTPLRIYASDTSLGAQELTDADLPNVWTELPDLRDTLERQYEVVAGRWPASYDELVLFLDENNECDAVSLHALGYAAETGAKLNYETMLSVTYRLLRPTDYYQAGADGCWARIDGDQDLLREAVERGIVLHVVGIVRPDPDAAEHCFKGIMGYTTALSRRVTESVEESEPVRLQREQPDTDIFTRLPFMPDYFRGLNESGKAAMLRTAVNGNLGVAEQMAVYCALTGASQADAAALVASSGMTGALSSLLGGTSDARCAALCEQYIFAGYSTRSFSDNLSELGADGGTVTELRLYCSDFENREAMAEWLRAYNLSAVRGGEYWRTVEFEDDTAALVDAAQSGGRLLPLLLSVSAGITLLLAFLTLRAMLRTSALSMRETFSALSLWGVSARDSAGVLRLEALLPGVIGGLCGLGLSLTLCPLLNLAAGSLWGIPLHLSLSLREALFLPPLGVALSVLSALGLGRLSARLGRI